MTIDVQAIKQRLFADPAVRARILSDYGVTAEPRDPDAFAAAVVGQFDQAPAAAPLQRDLDDRAVFQGAAKALASNSRAWATFLRFERRLADLLGGYDPAHSHRAFEEGRLSVAQVAACLPGQSSTADATAIRAWAALLDARPGYYQGVKELGHDLHRFGAERLGRPLPDSRLILCLVGVLAGPCPARAIPAAVLERRRHLLAGRPNLPGMGYVLASEFFRNLRWDAFKPDRHVQRLFDRWFPGAATRAQPEVRDLQRLLGCRAKPLSAYLAYSLIGTAATPPGVPASIVDNLVWLLGAYAEKKGKESDAAYVREPG